MKENKLPNLEEVRFMFDQMAEEVHFWELLRNPDGEIKTWRLVFANIAALKTWDRATLDEIVNKTTDEIFGEGATTHYLPIVEKIMKEGQPHSFQDYFPNIDRYFRFTSVPFGEYFFTTGWDVTDFILKNQSLKSEKVNLLQHLTFIGELEQQVLERTKELKETNQELTEHVQKMKEEGEKRDGMYAAKLDKINELLLKQSKIVQNNAAILQKLNSSRRENRLLREEIKRINKK